MAQLIDVFRNGTVNAPKLVRVFGMPLTPRLFQLCSLIVVLLCFYFGHASRLQAQNASDFVPGLLGPKNGGVYVVAHRGVHDSIPENTLAAYQAAIEIGCDFVEIDIRTTKDHQLVSIHDSTVDKYTIDGTKGAVADLTLAELKKIDIGTRVDPKWANERVPTVEEIFELCQGKIGIYLDVKSAELDAIVEIVTRYNMEKEVLWYIPSTKVKDLREKCPTTWPMPDPGPESRLDSLLLESKPPVVASVWKYFSPAFVRKCHDNRAIVIVDDGGVETWKSLLDAGVDGIQSDHPAELIRYLKK